MKDIQALLPRPKNCVKLGNSLRRIRRDFILHTQDVEVARLFNLRLQGMLGFSLSILPNHPKAKISFCFDQGIVEPEGYKLVVDKHISLTASTHKGLLYGAYTLLQLIDITQNNLPKVQIDDAPAFEHRLYYHDITRGKVPNVSTLKQLIDEASYFKYNQFQLYIEHTFAFEGLEQAWFDKTPLTSADILELVAFAKVRGVELVPSLTTFGHMYEILRTPRFSHLCERQNPSDSPFNLIERMDKHTLNPFDEESFALVCKMLDQYLPLFESAYVNICCDETFDLCQDKNKTKIKTDDERFEVYCHFVQRIANYIKAQGKQVMMWDDILLKGNIDQMPDDITYLDWDYAPEPDENKRKRIAQKPNVYACCGSHSWNRLVPDYDTFFKNADAMCDLALRFGMKGFCLTCWGDFGDIIKNLFYTLPLAYVGAVAWEGKARKDKEAFLEYFGWLAYKDKQLPSLMVDMASYHIITWYELVYAVNEHYITQKNVAKHLMEKSEQAENVDYAKLSIIEEMLYTKLLTTAHKGLILELITVCQGLKIFNNFNLQTYQYRGSLDKLAKFWATYQAEQRQYNNESEMARLTEVVRSLMLRFRTTGKGEK